MFGCFRVDIFHVPVHSIMLQDGQRPSSRLLLGSKLNPILPTKMASALRDKGRRTKGGIRVLNVWEWHCRCIMLIFRDRRAPPIFSLPVHLYRVLAEVEFLSPEVDCVTFSPVPHSIPARCCWAKILINCSSNNTHQVGELYVWYIFGFFLYFTLECQSVTCLWFQVTDWFRGLEGVAFKREKLEPKLFPRGLWICKGKSEVIWSSRGLWMDGFWFCSATISKLQTKWPARKKACPSSGHPLPPLPFFSKFFFDRTPGKWSAAWPRAWKQQWQGPRAGKWVSRKWVSPHLLFFSRS